MVVSSVTPPLGPLGGGKVVLVRGANFDGGSAPRVAFGELTPVVASHVGAGELRCLTPSGEAAVGTVEVRVSLNGAQYSLPYREAVPGYFFHPPLETDLGWISAVAAASGGGGGASGQTVLIPASGPPLGGTTVFVNSSLLEDVTRRERRDLTACRFGGELDGEVVAATAGSSDEIPGAVTGYPGIICVAPPVTNASAVLPLNVEVALSLNRQDFVTAAGNPITLTFTLTLTLTLTPTPTLTPTLKTNPKTQP